LTRNLLLLEGVVHDEEARKGRGALGSNENQTSLRDGKAIDMEEGAGHDRGRGRAIVESSDLGSNVAALDIEQRSFGDRQVGLHALVEDAIGTAGVMHE
jgi:hypothetical protein